ncbi:uncharacterized protein LOC116423862 [Nomia melanderi]|uniref:uncharacterized protein LOC116423862 n=1 Tax=Nomia melanderi TaxID=2448451 RepID=UPI0013046D65|nr:uncharacterized protein LOC116423862 [Nomia melanderi]
MKRNMSLTMKLSPRSQRLKTSPKRNDSLAEPNLSNVNINKRHSLSTYKVSKSPRIISQSKSKKIQKISDIKQYNTRKFPKSPKIMLRLPKSKSPSKKLSLSELKVFNTSKTVSPMKKRRSTFSRKSNIDKTNFKASATYNTDIVTFISKNSVKDTLLLKKPIVLLQRLPNNIMSKSSSTSFLEMHVTDLHSSTKRSALNSKNNNDKINVKSSSKFLGTVTKPLMFSTPINKQRVANGTRKSRRISNNMIIQDTENQISLVIENEQTVGEKKNETYELIEPKTPNLRNMLHERRNMKTDKTNSNKRATKKNLEVNFKSPVLDISCSEVPPSRIQSNKKKLAKESNNVSTRVNINKNAVIVSTALLKTPDSVSKRTVPSIKKSGSKNSSTKKVPNFAKIHKKLFAKSESIINVKKRLEERHMALTKPTINNLPRSNTDTKNNSLSRNSNKDDYNRFGYRIRKDNATNYILRKYNADLIRNKQQKNREILKGVRTNRRFELQMKSRNVKF